MQIRQHIFKTYWEFAAKRQDIFFARYQQQAAPWTNDPILQQHKFCNAYRVLDRASQFCVRNIIYSGSQNEEETLFRIILFKLFNSIDTWVYLSETLGECRYSHFSKDIYSQLLSHRKKTHPIYSSAYISCANKAFGFDQKHDNHLALIEEITKPQSLKTILHHAKNPQKIFEHLRSFPLIGDFMAYQLMTDINYSPLTDWDENRFTVAGPGAIRGIKKCFIDTKNYSYADVIYWMQAYQDTAWKEYNISFQSLFGRPLQAIDCQNLFCETDKYCRKAFPEISSNRTKIKHVFKKNTTPIDYMFPPKWNIKNTF